MKHWNVPKKDSGFTLIEMLVVTIVIGVIAAIAVPNLLGLLYKARVNEGVANIESAIKEAQRQATRLSKTCVIQFETTTVVNFGRTEQRAFITRAASVPGGPDYTDCLLNDRILPSQIVTVINNNPFPSATTPGTIPTITFSGRGNTNNNNTIVVYHPDLSTASERCLVLNGIFGDIAIGNHQDTTDNDPTTIGTCNIN